MKITVPGELTIDSTQFATFVPVKAEDMKQVLDFTTKAPKLTEAGLPLFRSNLTALRVVDGSPATPDDVNLSISKPVDLLAGVFYGLFGPTTINHYVDSSSGRMKVTVTAETVKPVDEIRKLAEAQKASSQMKLNLPKNDQQHNN